MNARYDFGRNWSELAARFEEAHLDQACDDLRRLVGDVEGRTFLDIGCGSGLHSAAALRLGARKVRALDYYDRCVETTKAVLHRFAPQEDWLVGQADVLDKTSLPSETFDIVYSWGVLHHTGDMWTAIRNAADLVGSEGRFGIAIYLKTPLCGLWTIEEALLLPYVVAASGEGDLRLCLYSGQNAAPPRYDLLHSKLQGTARDGVSGGRRRLARWVSLPVHFRRRARDRGRKARIPCERALQRGAGHRSFRYGLWRVVF